MDQNVSLERDTAAAPSSGSVAAPRAGAPRGPRVRRRTSSRILGALLRAVLLAVLTSVVAWKAITSPALARALASEERGDYANALTGAFEHLASRPWSREANRVVARCLSRLDYAEKAESYYEKAGPLTLEDRYYRAFGLVRSNSRDRAVAAYDAILNDHPDDVTALKFKAGVLLSESRWVEVLFVADILIARPTGQAVIYAPVAKAGQHWTLDRISLASPAVVGYTLKGIVHHDLTTPAADHTKRDLNEANRAIMAFEKVLELDPELKSMPLDRRLFWLNLGADLLTTGRTREVLRYLGPVAEEMKNPDISDVVAQAYFFDTRYDDAERLWKEALELNPGLVSGWLNLGKIELIRDHADEAVRLMKKALELAPNSYAVAYSLSNAYRRMGLKDEARHYQDLAVRLRRSGGVPLAGPGGSSESSGGQKGPDSPRVGAGTSPPASPDF